MGRGTLSLGKGLLGALAVATVVSCDAPPISGVDPVATKPRAAVTGLAQSGAWSAPTAWPIVAAHLAVLPDGRVMSWVSSDQAGDTERHSVHVWTPATGTFVEQTQGVHNAFCAAEVFLPDGRLLVAGGHIADNKGLKQTATYDYLTNTWSNQPSMKAGRWYPTATVTAGGTVVVVAGSDENSAGNAYPEVYDGTSWRELPGAPLNMPYYPWMHPTPDGRLFYAGPERITRYLNPSGGGEWTLGPESHVDFREYGGSIMYAPGKIIIMGGGYPPTNSAETIDLNAGTPVWTPTGSMQYPRRQMNSAILPNGKVLALGGSSGAGFNDEGQAVLPAEWWDPATGTWETLAAMSVPRLYHSSAVLLPDARVLYAGGGRCAGCTVNHFDAELFSPPYLFKADGTPATRPQITAAPASVSDGQTFTVQTPSAGTISRVTWVRLPAMTHSYNENQGFNELSFTRGAGVLNVTAPANAYLAPPGHYMLYVLDAAGVPSVAKVVQLVGTSAMPAAPGPPAAPTNLGASAVDNQRIRLIWTDNSPSETAFRIERCAGATCTNFAEIAQTAPNATAYRDSNLTSNATYRYRVRAQNLSGISAYTNTSAATTGAACCAPPPSTLVNRISGLCADVGGWSQAPGAEILLYTCHGGANQTWSLPAPGVAGAAVVYGSMCLAASGTADDSKVVIDTCNGGASQQWSFTGASELRSPAGKCIDLRGRPGGLYSLLVIAGCDGNDYQKWRVSGMADQPPVADFTIGCSQLSCQLNSSASTDDKGIASRAWSFGDGTTAGDNVSPLKSYTAAGTYTVKLTVTDAAGQTDVKQRTITVVAANKPPTPGFSFTCTGLACTFTDQSIDADGTVTKWAWVFGSGATAGSSAQRNPAYTFASAGSYPVALTVTDNAGTTSQLTKTVTVSGTTTQPPVPTVLASQAVAMCADVGGWSQAPGAEVLLYSCHGGANQLWTVPATGSSSALVVYGSMCLSPSATGADGEKAVLATCSAGAALQQWTRTAAGELRNGTGRCLDTRERPPALYSLLIVRTCDGNVSQKWSNATSGSTNLPPTASFTVSCNLLTCTFTDASTDADGSISGRSWNFGDGTTSTATNPTRVYLLAGSYTATLTVTDNGSATASASRAVTATTGPAPTDPLTLANVNTGLCADVGGWSQAPGAEVLLYTCHGGANQLWSGPVSGASASLVVYGTMCLAPSGTGAAGEKAVLATCTGAAAQRWTRTAAGELKTPAGLCLGVLGQPAEMYSLVGINTCNSTTVQRWTAGGP